MFVLQLIDQEINPHVDQWEAEGQFPAHKIFKLLGNAGFLGVNKPVGKKKAPWHILHRPAFHLGVHVKRTPWRIHCCGTARPGGGTPNPPLPTSQLMSSSMGRYWCLNFHQRCAGWGGIKMCSVDELWALISWITEEPHLSCLWTHVVSLVWFFLKKQRIGEVSACVQICCSSRFPSETLPSSRKDFITFQNRRAGSFLRAATSEVKDDPWLPAWFPLFWENLAACHWPCASRQTEPGSLHTFPSETAYFHQCTDLWENRVCSGSSPFSHF